jgi:hypothetical protein
LEQAPQTLAHLTQPVDHTTVKNMLSNKGRHETARHTYTHW